jgi:hypothetical protein
MSKPKSPKKQNGFALIVGVLLLLILTLLSLTAIRGTQLELLMATAVSRQEQAIEASDAARAMGRELMSASIIRSAEYSSRFVAPTDGDAVPNFAITALAGCPTDSGGDPFGGQNVTGGGATFIRGATCYANDTECMNIRLQQVNQTTTDVIPFNFFRYYPLTSRGTDDLCAQLAVTTVQLTSRADIGRDATGDELRSMFGLVARGNAPDGASSKTVALVSLRTPR